MSGADQTHPSHRAIRRGGLGAASLGLWLALATAPVAQTSPRTITLTADAQTRSGIATQPLAAVKRAAEIDAFAKVSDPAPLVQLESDFETAEAAAAASRAEAARARALHDSGGSVSAKDLETAEAQARTDALKVVVLHQQFGLQWGPGVARLSTAQRRRLVAGLARGAIALVHVDTHNNEGQAGARFVNIDIGSDSVRGAVIGPARAAEPRLQSSGLIVEVSGRSAVLLAVGLVQSAHIATTTAQTGVIIPRGAVIRFEGSDWVFVRAGPTRF